MDERKPHKYQVGSLVELENGVRMFIHALRWDCDGTPLYNFVALEEHLEHTDKLFFASVCGIHEGFITTVIKEAEVVEEVEVGNE